MLSRLVAKVTGVDGSELLLFLHLERHCFLLIDLPVSTPDIEALALIIHRTMNAPVETFEPLQLHSVELMDGNAAHFGPGSVLESVVIKKFAAKQQTCGKHAIDGARR